MKKYNKTSRNHNEDKDTKKGDNLDLIFNDKKIIMRTIESYQQKDSSNIIGNTKDLNLKLNNVDI